MDIPSCCPRHALSADRGRVQQLNLRMAAVETVAIQLPLLTLLDLSECVCLTSLQLSCPALTSLLAMGCPRLPDHQVLVRA